MSTVSSLITGPANALGRLSLMLTLIQLLSSFRHSIVFGIYYLLNTTLNSTLIRSINLLETCEVSIILYIALICTIDRMELLNPIN